ncbi:MAG: tetR [Sphingomonas bacterium]|nr:TetR/AcrR family transcriptional regulator C-terminal domain-containing protein [Sphingomonas bacterium]MDB5689341.1 tetR [Sphingomonas bacterium]
MQITEAALILLKEGGMRALSTRRLGERLGIKGASLYHHFSGKAELLAYVADAMFRPVWRAPLPGENWQDWLIATAVRLRAQLNAYPDGAIVAAGTSPPEGRSAETINTLYAPLLAAGFAPETARNALITMLRFVGGWAADEQVAQRRGVARPATANDAAFTFGVRVIVRGVEQELADGPELPR